MRIIRLEQAGKILGYFTDSEIAAKSLEISYSAFENVVVTRTLMTLTISRQGFDDFVYSMYPVDLITQPQHL